MVNSTIKGYVWNVFPKFVFFAWEQKTLKNMFGNCSPCSQGCSLCSQIDFLENNLKIFSLFSTLLTKQKNAEKKTHIHIKRHKPSNLKLNKLNQIPNPHIENETYREKKTGLIEKYNFLLNNLRWILPKRTNPFLYSLTWQKIKGNKKSRNEIKKQLPNLAYSKILKITQNKT